ncbi:hypothetical protein LTS18_007516, partial [Coniosporium uncinatum]
WFDIMSLSEPWTEQEKQIAGLAENVRQMYMVVEQEARLVGRENIVIGGLSQGCATSLVALMGLIQPVGGYIGIAGWLPLVKDIKAAAFQATDTDEQKSASQMRVARSVQSALGLPLSPAHGECGFAGTPCMLGHGTADPKVVVKHGEEARDVLTNLGANVTWKPYADFGHWWKEPDTIDDIAAFFLERVSMTVAALDGKG